MTWWHGGPRIVGFRLDPPAVTGVCRSDAQDLDDPWVYISSSKGLATTYASSCTNGWLYEVEPVGEVSQDPGSILAAGTSMRCHSALILRRFKPSRAETTSINATLARIAARFVS